MNKLKLFLLLILLAYSTVSLAAEEKCYLRIKSSGGFDTALIESQSLPVFNTYIEKLSPTPYGGLNLLKEYPCNYNLSISIGKDGVSLSVDGRTLNALATSPGYDLKAVSHALLKAIYFSENNPKLREKICRRNPDLMKAECSPVSGLIAIYDANGRLIPDGATVKTGEEFNFFIQPDRSVYAYVISRDSNGKYFKVFPNPAVTEIKNPLRQKQKYFLPPANSELVFAFDENTGREQFSIILSNVPVPEIDKFFKQLENSNDLEINQKISHQIKSRGIALKKKSKKVKLPQKSGKKTSRLIDYLEARGSFVKIINLNHI